MQEERDYLTKHVFPSIRSLCADRGLSFSEVDLRWGITAEQAQSGEVIEICLREIDRCTYFVNMLGARYGWIPTQYAPQVISKYPWLAKVSEKSVTELEGKKFPEIIE